VRDNDGLHASAEKARRLRAGSLAAIMHDAGRFCTSVESARGSIRSLDRCEATCCATRLG
jgi:hypothetical protein